MKNVLVLFLLLACFGVRAQVRPIYFIADSITTDKSKATHYGVFGKISTDTLWTFKLYDLRNNLVQVGTFADSLLMVPVGKFSYYGSVDDFNYDHNTHFYFKQTDRFLAEQGQYVAGKRSGRWVEFFPDGKILSITVYLAGLKHGEYKLFNQRGKLLVAGQHDLDLRDGEWKYLEGKKETYKSGELIAIKP
ncbi:hypothetical protein VRU48_02315 [Pedobacter sp. KR3-3]|uniref:Uncharacterized protein n=1 Tax=Pedobacter albus TaxID=3113905 RepID=A0ABU7I3F3_9SPHI|nr:hypothetical protein [Pedobacter sp. KR3-3]MEE1943924.1 hypothetical protein [Pedobacter sp. KR3-3]